ncbi:uncharacterized protein LOC110857840 isoform X2 [Folsomia candida]|uniref:uncharacterized protein LOC110857840 isoform X2 n=1 Tax=Folsomia candida TaxID=158441 RepID=UPI000B8EFD31|nr:uncharacterized protein LOC110857840 isoform X2 [Folsomia candida]
MSSSSDSGLDEQAEECAHWHPFITFRPLTRQNLLHFYLPLGGSLAYSLLSVHIVKPSLFKRISPADPTNVLLTGSLAGACLYIYDRKHLKSLGKQKVGFSVFAAGMFNLGSLLIWAMIRAATTNKDTTVQVARVGLALGSSILLAKTGISYLQAIDDQTRESSPPK